MRKGAWLRFPRYTRTRHRPLLRVGRHRFLLGGWYIKPSLYYELHKLLNLYRAIHRDE